MTSPTRPRADSSSRPAGVRGRILPTARTASTVHGSSTAIPPAAVANQGVRAGLVSRVLAAALDAVVTLLLLCAGYLGLVGLRFLLSPRTFPFPNPAALSAVAALLGVEVVYLTVCWA